MCASKYSSRTCASCRKPNSKRTLSIKDEADFFARDLAARWLGDARKARAKRRRKPQARANRAAFTPHRQGVNANERHEAARTLERFRQQGGRPPWEWAAQHFWQSTVSICLRRKTFGRWNVNALLVRVGADLSAGGGLWNGPVDTRSNEFVYVPIPETKPVHVGMEKPYQSFA